MKPTNRIQTILQTVTRTDWFLGDNLYACALHLLENLSNVDWVSVISSFWQESQIKNMSKQNAITVPYRIQWECHSIGIWQNSEFVPNLISTSSGSLIKTRGRFIALLHLFSHRYQKDFSIPLNWLFPYKKPLCFGHGRWRPVGRSFVEREKEERIGNLFGFPMFLIV